MNGLWSKVAEGLWYSAMPKGTSFAAMVAVKGETWTPYPNERHYYEVVGSENGVSYAAIGDGLYSNHASALRAAKNFATESMHRVSDHRYNPNVVWEKGTLPGDIDYMWAEVDGMILASVTATTNYEAYIAHDGSSRLVGPKDADPKRGYGEVAIKILRVFRAKGMDLNQCVLVGLFAGPRQARNALIRFAVEKPTKTTSAKSKAKAPVEIVIDPNRRIRVDYLGPKKHASRVFYNSDEFRPTDGNYGHMLSKSAMENFPKGMWYVRDLGVYLTYDRAMSAAKLIAVEHLEPVERARKREHEQKLRFSREAGYKRDAEAPEGFQWIETWIPDTEHRRETLVHLKTLVEVGHVVPIGRRVGERTMSWRAQRGKHSRDFPLLWQAKAAVVRWSSGGARQNPWDDDDEDEKDSHGEGWKGEDSGLHRRGEEWKEGTDYRKSHEKDGLPGGGGHGLGKQAYDARGDLSKNKLPKRNLKDVWKDALRVSTRYGHTIEFSVASDIDLGNRSIAEVKCSRCGQKGLIRSEPILKGGKVDGAYLQDGPDTNLFRGWCTASKFHYHAQRLDRPFDKELAKPPEGMRFLHDGGKVVLEHRKTGFVVGWLQTVNRQGLIEVRAYLGDHKDGTPKTYKAFDDEYRARAFLIRSMDEKRRNPIFLPILASIRRLDRKAQVQALRREKARVRDGRKRTLLQAEIDRLTSQQKGMTVRRKQTVEFMCPECFATGNSEQGEPISIQHKKSSCRGTPILSSIWKSKPEREKIALRRAIDKRRGSS